MSLSRRAFLGATACTSFTASGLALGQEFDPAAGCAPSEGHKKFKTKQQNWERWQYTPPGLRNGSILWGYPVRPKIDVNLIPPQLQSTAASIIVALSVDKYFAMNSAEQKPYCDDPDRVQQNFKVSYPKAEDDELALDVIRAFGHMPAILSKLKSEERFLETLYILGNAHRKQRYKLHTDWMGVPKSAFQLIKDNEGDCKDFALARMMLALFLGVKPENAMVVFYLDGDKTKSIGHANLAIYHDKFGWVFVNGTGSPNDRTYLGQTLIYQNDQRMADQIKDSYLGMAVPIAYVTRNGLGQFDSLYGHSKAGMPQFKPRQIIPQRSAKFIAQLNEPVTQRPANFEPPNSVEVGP